MAYVQDGQRSFNVNSFCFDDCFNIELWDRRNSGTASSVNRTSTATNPGIAQLVTGTDTNGVCSCNFTAVQGSNAGNFIFGGGNFTWNGYFNLAQLANVTDDFNWWIGMHDGWQYSDPSNGTYFQYIRANSVNWQIVSNDNGTATTTTSSVAVSTGWHKFTIVGTPSQVTFYVDGINLGTINTNLPVTNVYPLNGHKLLKTAGTTSVNTTQDYFEFEQKLTNVR